MKKLFIFGVVFVGLLAVIILLFVFGNNNGGENSNYEGSNELMTQSGASNSIDSTDEEITVEENKRPVLKNLAVVLDTPNIQTKLAGDLLFDKKVVWEDGGSYSDKSFGEF